MTDVIPHRMAAEIEGDFVVFLIGMKITRPWKIHKWWPVFRAMRPMITELSQRPESGFLGYTFGYPVIVQYWRSFEHLEAYARDHDGRHWPAWVAFNKRTGQSRGDVGIWHETYKVAAGQYEAIYSGMAPFGLGKAGKLVAAGGRRETARGRVAGGEHASAPTFPVANMARKPASWASS
jgi:fumigallin biosynthesis monooxygenase-like protein